MGVVSQSPEPEAHEISVWQAKNYARYADLKKGES